MKLPIILTAAAVSLILGVVLESASIIAMIGFLATGICAGVLAQSMPRFQIRLIQRHQET